MRCSIEDVFFECIKNAQVADVKYLLSKDPRLVHSKKGFYQNTPLDYAISYYVHAPPEVYILRGWYWNIVKTLIERGGKCNASGGIPTEVSLYILKVTDRKRTCAEALRVFMGLKTHKQTFDLFKHLNKDVMHLISKTLLFDEAGGKQEWDIRWRVR